MLTVNALRTNNSLLTYRWLIVNSVDQLKVFPKRRALCCACVCGCHESKGDLHPGGQLHVPGDRGAEQTGHSCGPRGTAPGERQILVLYSHWKLIY